MTPEQALTVQASYNLGLTPIETAQRSVIRIGQLFWVIPLIAFTIGAEIFALSHGYALSGALIMIALLFSGFAVLILPHRIWRRWGYDMGADRLRIVRGYLFHTDTIVPFNRIQHIDVARGPVERLFGVATLVVHTAGTHNAMVSLSGLKPEYAEAMRETIRAQIKHDID